MGLPGKDELICEPGLSQGPQLVATGASQASPCPQRFLGAGASLGANADT